MESSSESNGVKIVEKTSISPPRGSVPPTSTIPLTSFDMMSYPLNPVQRLFLYPLTPTSSSLSVFLNTHIPHLKRSLSLTLRRYFPLSGKFLPSDPSDASSRPILSYTEGDGVDFIVAECCRRDFEDLAAHHPRQATAFTGLVPKLTSGVLAIQITLFPHSGIGIGCTYHHGATDGCSSLHFLNTWAAFSRETEAGMELPCWDRDMFPEPSGLADSLEEMKATFTEKIKADDGFLRNLLDVTPDSDSVRATFVVTRAQLESLRERVGSKVPPTVYLSGFTLATTVVWRCLVSILDDDKNEFESLNFFSNFRSQPTSSFPLNYFGNCLIPGGVKMRRDELVGEDGILKASLAINEAIQIMKSKPKIVDFNGVSRMFSLSGSTKFGVYKVDFGWGRPRKVEVITIGKGCCMSLAENRDEVEGGIEIGVVLSIHQFKHFEKLFLAHFPIL